MNKRDFIKSAAVLAGASAISPLVAASEAKSESVKSAASAFSTRAEKSVSLKKGWGSE